MNIALIIPGGVDRSGTHRVIPALLWLIERLAVHHRVHVISLHSHEEPGTYSLLNATVHVVGRSNSIRRVLGVLRHVHALGPLDAIHAFWGAPTGTLAALAGRLMHTPSVVSLWGGEHTTLPIIAYGSQLLWRSRLMVWLGCRLATHVTAPSHHRAALAQHYGVKASEIAIGVPADYFDTPAPNLFTGPSWHLLHVASLNRVKDQTMLLRAMRRICDNLADVHLDIVGEDTLKGQIQQVAATLGLSSYVHFHGFKTASEVRPFFQQAHLFLLTSQSEAGPLVVLESAAHGLPTVGTRVGHVADWAPDRAVAVSVGDDEALARETLTLLRDAPRRRVIGQAARDWTQAHDADWTARAFEQLYQHRE